MCIDYLIIDGMMLQIRIIEVRFLALPLVTASRFLLLVLTFFWSMTVYSQSADDLQRIQEQQNQINQLEQQRQNELLKEQDPRLKLPQSFDVEELPAIEGGSEQCFDVQTIELQGAHSMSEEDREALLQPFYNTCIGINEIKQLMRVITNYYIGRGYVTTRVYIPQQDLGNGVLKLLVVEGITSSIEMNEPDSRVNLATAFPGLEGKLLNLRDIEQGLDQINRLQSNNATMQLLPGDTPGKSHILITNQQSKVWNGNFSVDNYGSKSTGEHRATLTLGIDNPLGLNDFWSMSLSKNTELDVEHKLSQSALLSFNIPYGYWNYTGSHSFSEYDSLIGTATQTYVSEGNTQTTNLGLQRVLSRSQQSKLTLTLGGTHKNSKNYIEGTKLVSGSPKLTVLNANLTSVFAGLNGLWTLDGGIHRGVKAIGAVELPGAGDDFVPTVEFWKFNGSASYSKSLDFAPADLTGSWASSFNLQYANDYLYGSEQVSIGGQYTVRGFDGTSISGDRGFYWRNDLTFNTASPFSGRLAEWVGLIRPYIALDAGYIDKRQENSGGSMVGALIGVRNYSRYVNLDLGYGFPIRYPDRLDTYGDVDSFVLHMKVSIPL